MVLLGWRLREDLVTGQAWHRQVVAEDVHQRYRVGGRNDSFGVESFDVAGVLENRTELDGEGFELVRGQLQPGEPGDMCHVVGRDAGPTHGDHARRTLRHTLFDYPARYVDAVAQYPFLSDEWIEQSKKIREEYKDQVPSVPVIVRMNQVINEVPFGEGVIHSHVDTSSGQLEMDIGHLDSPDLTVTLSYDTAKAILVDADAAAAMNAFMSGRIRVDGDITKMIALQTASAGAAGDPAAAELVRRIQEMTE